VKSVTEKGSMFDYFGEKTLKSLKLKILGEFQIENAAIALKIVEIVSGFGFRVSGLDIQKGLKEAFISGRLEIINRSPLIILDGAHNPDKMKALVASIKTIYPERKITALIAIKEDKNAREILKVLSPICDEMIFTGYEVKADQGIIKSYNPVRLLTLLESVNLKIKLSINENPQEVIKHYSNTVAKENLLLITGSLYLVGEIKKYLVTGSLSTEKRIH
jgi:dihydrofolate synthase/folylpolyglutamate synthase